MRTKLTALFILVCTVIPGLSQARIPAGTAGLPVRTYGLLNGKSWLYLSDSERGVYMIAVQESIVRAKSATFQAEYVPKNDADLRPQLDQFFEDRRNALITITDAIKFLTRG